MSSSGVIPAMARIAALASIMVAVAIRPVDAGLCDLPGMEALAADLEQRVTKGAAPPSYAQMLDDWATCVRVDAPTMRERAPKLSARLIKACGVLLDRDPHNLACGEIVADQGVADLGSHDVVALIAERHEALSDTRVNELFERAGAPRAAALIIARWRDLEPIAAERERAHDRDAMNDWAVWRTTAAHALGALGGDDAKAFLAERRAATMERGVQRACDAATAAIDARLHRVEK
jgi:hypothetical protein